MRTKLGQHGTPVSALFLSDGLDVISVGLLDHRLTSSVTVDHIDGGSLGIFHGVTIATMLLTELSTSR
jgi:hypothetical protein